MSIPYPHSVAVARRHSSTPDGWGRPGLTDFVFLRTSPAWVQTLTAQEQSLLTQAGVTDAQYTVFLPSQDITGADRMAWGSRLLEIIDVNDPDGTGDHLEVVCREWIPLPAVPA